jgi:hypothetical protein
MAFYLPQAERIHMEERVQTAIDVAISQISKKKNLNDQAS